MNKKLREMKQSLDEAGTLIRTAMGTLTIHLARIQAVERFVGEIGPNDPRSSGFIAKRIREMLGIEKEKEEN